MRFFSFFACLFFTVAAAAAVEDVPVGAVNRDAEASLFYGDYYHSFRSYNYVESKDPALFLEKGLEGYLNSLFVIGNEKTIREECDRFSNAKEVKVSFKSSYLCGKYFVTHGKPEAADPLLATIKPFSGLFWPAQILRATGALLSNDPNMVLWLLKPADLPKYTQYELTDEYYLALARAYTSENKYDEALKNYQSVAGKSPFYIQALEETAWVFFKMRRFESSQVLLDVLIGNYESGHRVGEVMVTEATYYRARYLKAYQAISEKRTEGAAAEFLKLKTEYEKSMARLKPLLGSNEMLLAVRDQNNKWTDINNFPDKLNKQIEMISEWMGADIGQKFVDQIHLQMALTRETNRVEKFGKVITGDNAGYKERIKSLRDSSWNDFATDFDDALHKVSRDMDTLRVKAELGRLEIVWLKRAEGARSLDEVIDSYREQTRAVDEFMEK